MNSDLIDKIKKDDTYCDKHVFYGLKNLNDGFDNQTIRYFSEKDFEIVLERVKSLGLGIYGIARDLAASGIGTLKNLNTKSVKSGIQLMYENRISKLAETTEEIQTEICFSLRSKYASDLEELKHKSMEAQNTSRNYFIGLLEDIQDKNLEDIQVKEALKKLMKK
jgi:hypothetical protein